MKIIDIKVHVMGVPGPDGKTTRRNWIFVEVLTDEGLTGIGEATTEYQELAVAAQIESELRPRLLGLDPTDIEQIWQLGYRDFWWKLGVVHTSAMSGTDQALWDIAGKAAGLPVFKLLGSKVRERVRCYARPDFAAGSVTDAAMQAVAKGFDAFKSGQEDARSLQSPPPGGDRGREVHGDAQGRGRPGGSDDGLRRSTYAAIGVRTGGGAGAAEIALRRRAPRAEPGRTLPASQA